MKGNKMYDNLIKKLKQAKNCFAWVMISNDDGRYISISKKEVKNLISSYINEIEEDRFVLRDCGDLYIS